MICFFIMMHAHTYYDPVNRIYSVEVIIPLPSVFVFFTMCHPSHGTTQLVSPIAQHKTNKVNSLIRFVGGFISLILIQISINHAMFDHIFQFSTLNQELGANLDWPLIDWGGTPLLFTGSTRRLSSLHDAQVIP